MKKFSKIIIVLICTIFLFLIIRYTCIITKETKRERINRVVQESGQAVETLPVPTVEGKQGDEGETLPPVTPCPTETSAKVDVTTLEVVMTTPTPTPTIKPSVDNKCSMIDYTKQAMPGEKFQGIVNEILFSAYHGIEKDCLVDNKEFDEKIFFSHKYVYYQIDYFWEKMNGRYLVRIRFPSKPENAQDQFVNAMSWGDKVIRDLGITKDTTEKDAITKINNFMCDYFDYDFELYKSVVLHGESAVKYCYLFDAIERKTVVCEMYSQIFQLLCHKCGIECYFEVNDTVNHSYNKVILSGEEYYTDVSSNDTRNTKVFLLSEKKNFFIEHGWFFNHTISTYDFPYGH